MTIDTDTGSCSGGVDGQPDNPRIEDRGSATEGASNDLCPHLRSEFDEPLEVTRRFTIVDLDVDED